MTPFQKRTVAAAAIVAAAALCVYYSAFDPATSPAPRCMLRLLTGYDCPGCGSQRALHALLHGRVGDAWGYNPAVFFAVPLAAAYFAIDRLPPGLRRLLRRPAFILAIAVAIVALWIGRNMG